VGFTGLVETAIFYPINVGLVASIFVPIVALPLIATLGYHVMLRKRDVSIYDVFIVLTTPVISKFPMVANFSGVYLKKLWGSEVYFDKLWGLDIYPSLFTVANWLLVIVNIVLFLNLSFALRNRKGGNEVEIPKRMFYFSLIFSSVTSFIFPSFW